ncbi:hypothetical protein [Plantactinospora sp. CA-290183]|uniref:hypothetical protein n=1 Tax=Plantactinospora sp. CA-290183 TaxID=3240006 RepID=UPI003D8ACC01
MTATTLRHGRCITCETPTTGLARLTRRRSYRDVLERVTTPPAGLIGDGYEVQWFADPCLCPIVSAEAWDAVIDAG